MPFVIVETSQDKFTINGIEYFKNFLPHAVDGNLRIINAYDSDLQLAPFNAVDEYTVDGITYGNIADLQSALLPVLYTRNTLGGAGSAVWGSITGNIQSQTDLIDLLNQIAGSTIENYYGTLAEMISDLANQTQGRIQYVEDASPDATGYAYYEYLGTGNGNLTDYRRLSDDEADVVDSSLFWMQKTVQDIGPTFADITTTQSGTVRIENGGSGFVTKILFDNAYFNVLKYLRSNWDEFSFEMRVYNINLNNAFNLILDASESLEIDGNYVRVPLEKSTLVNSFFSIGDKIILFPPAVVGRKNIVEQLVATGGETTVSLGFPCKGVIVVKNRTVLMETIDYTFNSDSLTLGVALSSNDRLHIHKLY